MWKRSVHFQGWSVRHQGGKDLQSVSIMDLALRRDFTTWDTNVRLKRKDCPEIADHMYGPTHTKYCGEYL